MVPNTSQRLGLVGTLVGPWQEHKIWNLMLSIQVGMSSKLRYYGTIVCEARVMSYPSMAAIRLERPMSKRSQESEEDLVSF